MIEIIYSVPSYNENIFCGTACSRHETVIKPIITQNKYLIL